MGDINDVIKLIAAIGLLIISIISTFLGFDIYKLRMMIKEGYVQKQIVGRYDLVWLKEK